MGVLLKLAILAVAGYLAWSTVRGWLSALLGMNRRPAAPPPQPASLPPAGKPIVEDTRRCAVCGAYVSVAAGKCGRPDCP
ncbi:MAG: hypothetical protein OJF58_003700 [Enhydrobacter sp.]|jgi:hypothetical protein|nr:MAG: hypothetical protein OJF58_003700 [Enhydrobacter sp.]